METAITATYKDTVLSHEQVVRKHHGISQAKADRNSLELLVIA